MNISSVDVCVEMSRERSDVRSRIFILPIVFFRDFLLIICSTKINLNIEKHLIRDDLYMINRIY